MKKALLTIAGFDPSSGAGATLDLKVFHRLGFYGLAVLTAVTVQNSYRVFGLKVLPPDLVRQQYQKLQADFNFSGLKIGMIGRRANIRVIEEIISENQNRPVVVDPVFRSSSGYWLLEKESIKKYLRALSGKITLLTPNLEEASLLLGQKIKTANDMEEAVINLSQLSCSACLIKGGHLPGRALDILYDGRNLFHFEKEKLKVKVHGTGCFLSSAILGFLVIGLDLQRSCEKASSLIHRHLKSSLKISQGRLFDI
ncbi:MAG: bifunctional hydroxymethylpyrimidine kinase/phosphomethylpyrimidine kinase [Candidatus Saccharicenans sp.]